MNLVFSKIVSVCFRLKAKNANVKCVFVCACFAFFDKIAELKKKKHKIVIRTNSAHSKTLCDHMRAKLVLMSSKKCQCKSDN